MNKKTMILDYLQKNKKATVHELADFLNLSDISVRRYLGQLEQENLVKRNHGGAELPVVHGGIENPFDLRININSVAKDKIAALALDYINDGDHIAFDLGTTTYKLAEHVVGQKNITCISYSLKICGLLLDQPGIRLLVPAGEPKRGEGAIVGDIACAVLDNFFCDTFFLGAAGLSSDGAITDYYLDELLVKRKLIENAKQTILLMDHEKFGQRMFTKVSDLKNIDILITDQMPDKNFVQLLKENNVQIVIGD